MLPLHVAPLFLIVLPTNWFIQTTHFSPGIVEQVVSRLITRSPVAVMFLSLLRKITVDRPHLAAEIVPRLKEALEYD